MRSKVVGGAFLCTAVVCSIVNGQSRSATSVALADAGASFPDKAWSITRNPAFLSSCNNYTLSVLIIPDRFGLKELQSRAISSSIPLSIGTAGLSVEHFGFDLYNESFISVGIGRILAQDIAGGITFHYMRVSIQGYGTEWVPQLTLGIAGVPAEMVTLGGVVRNIFGARIGSEGERLPQVVTVGVTVSIDETALTAELEKDVRYPLEMKFGVEQSLSGAIVLRGGLSNNPEKISAGFSMKYGVAEFGYAGSYHTELGWTHHLELTLEFPR